MSTYNLSQVGVYYPVQKVAFLKSSREKTLYMGGDNIKSPEDSMKNNVRKMFVGIVKFNKKNLVVLAILFIANTVALNLEYSKELKKRGWKFSLKDFQWHKETTILFKAFEENEAREIKNKLKFKYGLIGCLISGVLRLFGIIDVY